MRCLYVMHFVGLCICVLFVLFVCYAFCGFVHVCVVCDVRVLCILWVSVYVSCVLSAFFVCCMCVFSSISNSLPSLPLPVRPPPSIHRNPHDSFCTTALFVFLVGRGVGEGEGCVARVLVCVCTCVCVCILVLGNHVGCWVVVLGAGWSCL